MRPRVLLVEDDASLQRFVAMALDEFDLDLLCCDAVACASASLAQQPVDLVLTDLTLVDGSALAFAESTARAGRSRVAVFSAGVTPEVERQLDDAGVWRILRKPVPLADLQACVADALAVTGRAGPAEDMPAAAGDGDAADAAAEAADQYFGGDRALMDAYVQRCRMQFAEDVATGDRAVQSGDAAALRRLAHSLKTVLLLVGHPQEAALAAAIDRAVQGHDLQAAARGWQPLRLFLAAATTHQG